MMSRSAEGGLLAAVLDALTSHICVLNSSGTITLVNEAWRKFALENTGVPTRTGVGTHYLQVCQSAVGPGAEEARVFAEGVRAVLEGKSDLFQLEYPCHAPTEDRWFVGRVTPLKTAAKGAVVSHQNVTDRKRVEFELARLAATDPLTGLPNRRYFLEVAAREVERVKRFDVPAAVVMMDIDHFKAVNDTYGHAVGDEALRRVASLAKGCLREIDVLARLGGEEFALLLPGTTEKGAGIVAEKLRAVLFERPVDDAFGITASFGVTEVESDDLSIDDGLRRADGALYAAKHSGRNRVFAFSELMKRTDPDA